MKIKIPKPSDSPRNRGNERKRDLSLRRRPGLLRGRLLCRLHGCHGEERLFRWDGSDGIHRRRGKKQCIARIHQRITRLVNPVENVTLEVGEYAVHCNAKLATVDEQSEKQLLRKRAPPIRRQKRANQRDPMLNHRHKSHGEQRSFSAFEAVRRF